VTARRDRTGPLLVTLPGVAALVPARSALAQARGASSSHPASEASTPQVIVSATRLADAALTAKVVQVLKDDPYVFADHISVVTENGS
jgi:osmotically-inducible protein OsmY